MLELVCSSTNLVLTSCTNSPWIESFSTFILLCQLLDRALMATSSHAVVANRAQHLAAAWLSMAGVGPSPQRAGTRYQRSYAAHFTHSHSLSPSPLLSLALAAEHRVPPHHRTAPPSPSTRSSMPLPPPPCQQLRHVFLYLLDMLAVADELR